MEIIKPHKRKLRYSVRKEFHLIDFGVTFLEIMVHMSSVSFLNKFLFHYRGEPSLTKHTQMSSFREPSENEKLNEN